jgi:hypothetical protein
MKPIILRQAMPRSEIDVLARVARDWYAELPLSDHPMKDGWLLGRAATLPNFPVTYRIFDLFGASQAADFCREYLGPVLAIPYNHALLRWRGPHTPSELVKFHRDRDLIADAYPMNAWIPLTPVDSETLGLAFEVDGEILEPTFEPGDIAIFNRDTLHGSLPPKPRDRISIEFRMGRHLADQNGVCLGTPH